MKFFLNLTVTENREVIQTGLSDSFKLKMVSDSDVTRVTNYFSKRNSTFSKSVAIWSKGKFGLKLFNIKLFDIKNKSICRIIAPTKFNSAN